MIYKIPVIRRKISQHKRLAMGDSSVGSRNRASGTVPQKKKRKGSRPRTKPPHTDQKPIPAKSVKGAPKGMFTAKKKRKGASVKVKVKVKVPKGKRSKRGSSSTMSSKGKKKRAC